MIRYSRGSVRHVRGRWQLIVRTREVDEGGNPVGGWKTMTTMTDLPASASEESAMSALLEWRDTLVGEEAVRAYRESHPDAEGTQEALVSELAKKLGIDEEQLGRRFVDYAWDYIDLVGKTRGFDSAKLNMDGSAGVLKRYVIPYLPRPDVTVREFDQGDIKAVLEGLAKKNYKPSVLKKAWSLMKSVANFAVRQHGLRPDPTFGIHTHFDIKPKVNFLPVAKADRLAERLRFMRQTSAICAARLALASGLCGEEMCGLRLCDCDPGQLDEIRVVQVIAKRGGTYVPCVPKTDYRRREIPMNDEIDSILRERMAVLEEELQAVGRHVDAQTYLLENGRSSRGWFTPEALRRAWSSVADSMGLVGVLGTRLTMHDLRHTFATSFLAKGGSFNDLKAIMGHSKGQMTLDVYAASDLSVRAKAMRETGRDFKSPLQYAKDMSPTEVLSLFFDFDGKGAAA